MANFISPFEKWGRRRCRFWLSWHYCIDSQEFRNELMNPIITTSVDFIDKDVKINTYVQNHESLQLIFEPIKKWNWKIRNSRNYVVISFFSTYLSMYNRSHVRFFSAACTSNGSLIEWKIALFHMKSFLVDQHPL